MDHGKPCTLPLDQIIGPKFLLRPVDKTKVDYLELTDSIRVNGLLQTVCVRPAEARAPGKFEIVTGNRRYNAHLDLGLKTIDVIIRYDLLTDLDVLAAQIRENAVREETSDAHYRRQINHIAKLIPGVSQAKIAVMINKTPDWVSRQMGLLSLDEATLRLVDSGHIPLSSAYKLAKIQPANRRTPELIQQAITLPAREFTVIADAIIKRRQEEVRNGRLDFHFGELRFEPRRYQRPIKEVEDAIKRPAILAEQIAIAGAKTPIEIAIAIAKWTIHLDRTSVDQKRREAEESTREDLKKLYGDRPEDDLTS